MKSYTAGLILGLIFLATTVSAQETYEELQAMVKADVLEIVDERVDKIYGTDALTTIQTIKAKITAGEEIGKIVTFENDLIQLEPGDQIYLNHVRELGGLDIYILKDVNRQASLIWLTLLFVGILLLFARLQGLRALLSLGLSVVAILWLLIPALLNGYDPVLVSLLIAGVILALVLFGTHGFNALSATAFGGTFLAVLTTSVIAWLFVGLMRLTGFSSDASVYLNFATNGQLDFGGLLLGSIIIGILGILDDVAITQASVVQELKAVNHQLGIWDLYQRGIKVGQDHVGALINTLALAYIGASLPLVLLFATSNAPLSFTLNQEVIASEIARIMIGSIGLVLAVPLTTLIAAWWFGTHGVDESFGASSKHHHH